MLIGPTAVDDVASIHTHTYIYTRNAAHVPCATSPNLWHFLMQSTPQVLLFVVSPPLFPQGSPKSVVAYVFLTIPQASYTIIACHHSALPQSHMDCSHDNEA